MRAAIRLACMLSLIAFVSPSMFAKDVKIEKKKPKIEKKAIDKNNPPPLEAGEDAVTLCDFSCEAEFDTEGKPQEKPSPEGCQVTITVSVASVEIDLDITEWLPEGAPEQLKRHEEGHADICEKVYEDAKKAAEEAAKKFGKKTITGRGKNCQEATEDAQRMAVTAFCDEYHGRTQAVAQRVSKIYDDLTDHGKNKKPEAGKAVKQAFEKDKENEKGKEKPKK